MEAVLAGVVSIIAIWAIVIWGSEYMNRNIK